MSLSEIPERDKSDLALVGLKGFLGMIPLGSGPVEVLNLLVTPSLEKRRDNWMREVGVLLEQLKAKQENILNELSNQEEFTSLLISATVIADKTHLKEKHENLRNALKNSVDSKLGFDVHQIYLQFIETLTLAHIDLLQVILDFGAGPENHNTYPLIFSNLLSHNMFLSGSPLQSLEINAFRFMLLDLQSKGLIFISEDIEDLRGNTTKSFLTDSDSAPPEPNLIISDFGKRFLEFIMTDIV